MDVAHAGAVITHNEHIPTTGLVEIVPLCLELFEDLSLYLGPFDLRGQVSWLDNQNMPTNLIMDLTW